MNAARRRLRCADAAAERGDPLAGNGVPVERWLLVEQPGPWGRDALTQSRLDPAVGAVLGRRASAAGVRPQLVRRHGRAGHHAQGRRHWAVVDSRPGREALRWGRFERDAELLDLDLAAAAAPDHGAVPVYLVCTHGRHDTCCAVRGREVVAALDRLAPGRVWETSHVGGCRFAANVVALPHGLYYGTTGPADVQALVEATESGHVVPGLLRGRSALPLAAQAAEHFAREHLGGEAARLNALQHLSTSHHGDGCVSVELAVTDRPASVLRVTVRRHDAGPPALLTCAATRPAPPQTWQLLDLAEAAHAEGTGRLP